MGGQVIVLVIAILFFVRTDRAQGYRTAYIGYITDEKWMVERKTPMAGYVRSHTQPGDYVLFWGAFPDENFLSNRDAPTKALFYPLYVDSDISRALNDQFLLDLKMNPPVLIVDMSDQLEVPSLDPMERQKQMAGGFTLLYTPDNLDQVFDLINKNYTLGGVISGKNIYRLNTAR